MFSVNQTARLAGLLYLMFILTTAFAGFVRSNLVVFGDASATARHIMASELLFRVGFMSDVIAAVLFLLSAWALYVLLKPVRRDVALLFLLLMVGGVAVQCLNMLNQFAALLLLSGSDYLKVFQPAQLEALALLFLTLHQHGFIIAQVFYGTWLLPLGYLVLKSGLLPRILGILLILDCLGVLIWFLQFFLFPGYDVITYPGLAISFVAEVSLSGWLLIKGVDDRKPTSLGSS